MRIMGAFLLSFLLFWIMMTEAKKTIYERRKIKELIEREKIRIYVMQSKIIELEKEIKNTEEKMALKQIIDAIVQADDEIVYAIQHKDREMLQDVLKEYLDDK